MGQPYRCRSRAAARARAEERITVEALRISAEFEQRANPTNGGNSQGNRGGRHVAKGHRVSETMISVNTTFDDVTFLEIAEMAKRAKKSFCAMQRFVVEVGLETLKMAGM